MFRNKSPMTLRNNKGFTLIELLVAITILSIIAVMGWAGLDGIIRARTSLNAQLDQSRGAQISFGQLENDCSHIASSLLPKRQTIQAVQGQLILIRTVFEDQQPTKLQIVAYRLQDSVLTRRESIATRDLFVLDTIWQSAINGTDNMPKVKLQNDVLSIEMRTWNDKEKMWKVGGDEPPIAPPLNPGQQKAQSEPDVPLQIGLELLMQIKGRDNPLLKIFLLGAA
jgi:general secretion pathway protein J